MGAFPGAGATVYRNEAGEPIGWDYPAEPDYAEQEDSWYGREVEDWEDEEEDEDGEPEPYVREDFGYFGDEALCGE